MGHILNNKADAIMNALVEAGWIEVEPSQALKNTILDALANGGNFQLFESPHGLVTKTIIRDESGQVIGRQG
jgi:hypothetical protein